MRVRGVYRARRARGHGDADRDRIVGSAAGPTAEPLPGRPFHDLEPPPRRRRARARAPPGPRRGLVAPRAAPPRRALRRAGAGARARCASGCAPRGCGRPGCPRSAGGMGLALGDFARVSEALGRSPLGHYAFHCQAPDVGNLELLMLHGSAEQRERWLGPLARGEIRSTFAMTEPEHAGSNPVHLSTTARRDGGEWVIDGHKWFATAADGAAFAVVMAMTDPENPSPYRRASMILVPAGTPGYEVVRNLPVMGDTGRGLVQPRRGALRRLPRAGREPPRAGGRRVRARPGAPRAGADPPLHALDRPRRARAPRAVPARGRARAGAGPAARLAPGGAALDRREPGGDRRRPPAGAGDGAQDRPSGARAARVEVSEIKFFVAGVLQRVVDRAIQAHGALGVTDYTVLSYIYRHERAARIYDGPDEVHKSVVAPAGPRGLRRRREGVGDAPADPVDRPPAPRPGEELDPVALRPTWRSTCRASPASSRCCSSRPATRTSPTPCARASGELVLRRPPFGSEVATRPRHGAGVPGALGARADLAEGAARRCSTARTRRCWARRSTSWSGSPAWCCAAGRRRASASGPPPSRGSRGPSSTPSPSSTASTTRGRARRAGTARGLRGAPGPRLDEALPRGADRRRARGRAHRGVAGREPPGRAGAALIHNDFKYDNLVLDPGDLTEIVAVLDWEMATVGDPLMDLGSSLAYWIDPDDPEELRSPAVPHLTALPGNLRRGELVARYLEATGRDPGAPATRSSTTPTASSSSPGSSSRSTTASARAPPPTPASPPWAPSCGPAAGPRGSPSRRAASTGLPTP